MQKSLLSTKLNVLPPRPALVPRAGLVSSLSRARNYRLTLVSAPPGYGKTTLVSSWLRETVPHFTWLSLDEGDNDPIRFLEYFLTALHNVVPAIGLDMLDLVQGSQAASLETLITLLINETESAGDFFLVLDDFHVLNAQHILDMLSYMLDRLPPPLHLVILSRTDPPLPLSRLRARDQLLEIRAEQLRFTPEEIAIFFKDVMGLELSDPDLLAIETRTEGWIAGLQLAGLAMQSALASQVAVTTGKDPHSFIATFSGSHAYIMDYLMEEILRHQPETVRTFLLQTSILERMCGPLCKAVVESSSHEPIDSQAMLEAIERDHLFVIPLDIERRWYRYHHLFKEVLSRRLEFLYPEQIPTLHRRASEWFEQQGLIHEAVQHAMNTGESDRTVRLVEQHGCNLLMGGELVTLAGWLAAIEPYTQTHPWLAMQKAWVFSLSGNPERAELAIDAGEQLLSTFDLTDEVRTLRGSLAAARAHCANMQRNTDLAAKYAWQAIHLLRDNTDFSCSLRIVATSLLGDASLAQGQLDEARRAYTDAVRIGEIAGNPHIIMMSNTSLADVYFEQGRFHQAARLYTETLQMAERIDGPNSISTQGVHFGLGRVFYAWNRLDEAAVSCEQSCQLSRRWGNENLQPASFALTACLERARGNLEKAQEAAAAAAAMIAAEKRVLGLSISPYWSMWVKTALARFWLDQGEIEKALLIIHDIGIFPENCTLDTVSLAGIPLETPIPYLLEPAYLILARLFLALGNPDAVLAISEHLIQEAKTWGRGKVVIELQILQALAFQAKKDTSSALAALESAVALAWPEQFTRVFLDGGESMGKLLYHAKARGIGGMFVTEMLNRMGGAAGAGSSLLRPYQKSMMDTEPARGQGLLVEPLSARELEVLRCIAEGCSNQEIADRFFLSPKTVKRHISNIYAKLEAKSRTQAVSLARSLKLIE